MPAASTTTPISPAELSYLHTSLCHNPPIRPDSRSATGFRPFRAETDLLPACNGSSHLSLADGSEAIVGVKADIERNNRARFTERQLEEMVTKMKLESAGNDTTKGPAQPKGDPRWVSLNVDISTLRDDDPLLVFLGEMLREPLLASAANNGSGSSLADALVINKNWHWELHIDVLLLSPFTATPSGTATGYPLPLLSLAIHLALRSTRLPKLKSQGEEDPLVNDDWEQSLYLFPDRRLNGGTKKKKKEREQERHQREDNITSTIPAHLPAITLLVMTAGSNIIFDPSSPELAVADAIFAVSVIIITTTSSQSSSLTPHHQKNPPQSGGTTTKPKTTATILAVRTVETPARQTMKGVSAATTTNTTNISSSSSSAPSAPATDTETQTLPNPGLWTPKLGGVKPDMIRRVVRAVVGDEDGAGGGGGVAREVFEGIETFLQES